MKPAPFAMLFVAACAVLGFTGLSLRGTSPPPGIPPVDPMVAYGRALLASTYAIIGPEVADPDMRYAGR